jgi:hypothetical protein
VGERDDRAAVVGHEQLELDVRLRQQVGDPLLQLGDPLAGAGRDEERIRREPAQHEPRGLVDEVGLVEHDDLGQVARAGLADHIAHGRHLRGRIRMRAVDHVHDQVGLADLLERRAERLHELMRQVAHEAHRVAQRVEPAVGRARTPHRRVEGREQRVLHEHTGARDAVQQARLARVRVARDRHAGHGEPVAVGPLRLARRRVALDLPAQLRHPAVDAAAVELDLRLTGTAAAHALTAGGLTTGLPRHRLAPASEAREQVLELRELDLRLALAALRVLAEDVEDHRGAVDDLHLHDILERTALTRCELGVGDHGVGAEARDDRPELVGLAAADVGGRVRMRAALQQPVEHGCARGLGERGQLAERVLGVVERAAGVDADEHDVLEPELPVLDLGDVVELGTQAGDTTQRRALLAVELVAVAVVEVVVAVLQRGRA